jgi:Fic family protein
MKIFDYKKIPASFLVPDVVALIASIHEHKGRQDLFIESEADILEALMEVAKIQSTTSSNAIEGIIASDKRLEELVKQKSEPKNRNEQEISGYREVLSIVHENFDVIPPTTGYILQLHKQLYSFTNASIGDSYKNSDNFISEEDTDGNKKVRFQPIQAFLTPSAMEDLCSAFMESIEKQEHDPLLLIPMFIFDFLCIHPLNDGNGRISLLLTLLLLYRSGYIVGKYISIERLIEKSKETYYEVLQNSSVDWHENKNDYMPFIRYFLGILQKACNEFEERIKHLQYSKSSKKDRIKTIIDRHIGKISKSEIMSQCPDISKKTVERALNNLIKSGYIATTGKGPITAYVKVVDLKH